MAAPYTYNNINNNCMTVIPNIDGKTRETDRHEQE